MASVDERVHRRHPDLDDPDVIYAWEHYLVGADRIPGEIALRVGVTPRGKKLEMIGALTVDGWHVFHAMDAEAGQIEREIDSVKRRRS